MRLSMVPFSRLFAALKEIPDPRRAEGKPYPLASLVLFTIMARLSGAQSYRGILTFLTHRRETLNAVFGTHWKRAPALNTLRDGLHHLDEAAVEAARRRHAQDLLPPRADGERLIVALDGKTLKGSFDHLKDRKPRRPWAPSRGTRLFCWLIRTVTTQAMRSRRPTI
jgi:hypothetical protein